MAAMTLNTGLSCTFAVWRALQSTPDGKQAFLFKQWHMLQRRLSPVGCTTWRFRDNRT